MKTKNGPVNRRDFLKTGAAVGASATVLTAQESKSGKIRFDHAADVVVVGAGAAGLPAAIMAREQKASVIVLDENYSIGGHAMFCLLYTSPSPRDRQKSRMPSSA